MAPEALATVVAVLRRHEARLMTVLGVIGVGVGTLDERGGGRLCIRVLADRAVAPDAVPSELEGVPVRVAIVGAPRQQGG